MSEVACMVPFSVNRRMSVISYSFLFYMTCTQVSPWSVEEIEDLEAGKKKVFPLGFKPVQVRTKQNVTLLR